MFITLISIHYNLLLDLVLILFTFIVHYVPAWFEYIHITLADLCLPMHATWHSFYILIGLLFWQPLDLYVQILELRSRRIPLFKKTLRERLVASHEEKLRHLMHKIELSPFRPDSHLLARFPIAAREHHSSSFVPLVKFMFCIVKIMSKLLYYDIMPCIITWKSPRGGVNRWYS